MLIDDKHVQPDLFDERNLFEFTHPDFPSERLIACRNLELAKLRAHKRQDMLQATERDLEKIRIRVEAGRLSGPDDIGLRVGKVINKYKMSKHFDLDIKNDAFSFQRKSDSIAAESALDGIYIIRTSVSTDQMNSADCVRNYKLLVHVDIDQTWRLSRLFLGVVRMREGGRQAMPRGGHHSNGLQGFDSGGVGKHQLVTAGARRDMAAA